MPYIDPTVADFCDRFTAFAAVPAAVLSPSASVSESVLE